MEFTEIDFNNVKQLAEEYYKTIGEVRCPYLKDGVSFNAKGLDHIKFKEWDKARSMQDQYVRLRLLKIAPQILQQSHTLQEFFETNRMERQKINSRWENRMISVNYYGFVAIVNRHRLKVIVKEIQGGKKFFWSLIPFWKTKKDAINGNKKVLHEGDLEAE
jgi:hypothetical protein